MFGGLGVIHGLIALGLIAGGGTQTAAISHQTSCFGHPSRCGYPDATNTGVPAGTSLSAGGSQTVTDDGAVLDGLEIKGTLTIAASDVTVENSRIVAPSGGSGSFAVILNEGADDFTIENSEVDGPASNQGGLESAVWNHYDNPGANTSHVYFHHCADCWEGSGTFRDSYMVVDAAYSGSHDEDIYVCGGVVHVIHSTLINRHPQTATVFGDTSGCGANHMSITGSLLAGGGYVVYPQANSSSPTGTMKITGNRFARCHSAPKYDRASGGTDCGAGPDQSGIFPNGGYFGIAAYYYLGGPNVWKKNVWDDNLRPVCPTGSCPKK
jgi:hypothetical protein